MANSRGNQTPAIVIYIPAETSNSETITHTQQAPTEQARVTDEQGVVSVNANLDDTSPEGTKGSNGVTTEGITQDKEVKSTRNSSSFNEETTEGITQDNEVESTRVNPGLTADRVTDVNQSSVSSGPSLGTDTRPHQTEPTGDKQMEVTNQITDVTQRSVSSASSLTTDAETSWTEPVVNVLNWIDHVPNRRTRGVRSSSWQHGYRAGMRATMSAVADYGLVANASLLPQPLFSDSPSALHRSRRTESTSGHVEVIRRETSQEQGATSDTVSELNTNAAEISATATPTRVVPPFVLLTTTPGRPRVTSILTARSPSNPSLAGQSTSPSAPLVATNENLYARPSRSSMMEYAKATEDVNDMKRFGDEGGEDEVVPGGLVRGSPVGGYPKRRSSVLRKMNTGRRERESALYQRSLTKAVEEENSWRMSEIMETLRTGAERSGGGIKKLFTKGKKMLSKLLN